MVNWFKNIQPKLETALFAVISYILIDNNCSVINLLSITTNDAKYIPILDFLIFQLILNVIWEAIKIMANAFYQKKIIQVDIQVRDKNTNGEVIYFNSSEKNKDIKINLKVHGKRSKNGEKYNSLGTIQIVFPYWLGANDKLKGSIHDGAFKFYEQNVQKKIEFMYILVDLDKLCRSSEVDGIIDEDKELYLSVNCEDDESMSSKKKLVISWNKENFIHKLNKNDFEFQYTK